MKTEYQNAKVFEARQNRYLANEPYEQGPFERSSGNAVHSIRN